MAYLVLMQRPTIGELTTTDAEGPTVTDRSAFRIAARMRSFAFGFSGILRERAADKTVQRHMRQSSVTPLRVLA